MSVRLPSWPSLSLALLLILCGLQLYRWLLFPRFMDIFYHLHTAWGFIQAGGWSWWDRWEYAPVGRVHYYPPLLHLVLALFLKLGLPQLLLAKITEVALPVLFFIILRLFVRNYMGEKQAFFGLLVIFASFPFFESLGNYPAATLGLIFALLAAGDFLDVKSGTVRPLIFLTACFYSHIAVSLYAAVGFIALAVFNKQKRFAAVRVLAIALLAASPLFYLYAKALPHIRPLASAYLPRFFQAEGFLAIVFSAAVLLPRLFKAGDASCGDVSIRTRPHRTRPLIFLLILALLGGREGVLRTVFTLKNPMTGILAHYQQAADFIKQNTEPQAIVTSGLDRLDITLAVLSQRRTANALLPESLPIREFDPLAASDIIILPNDHQDARIRTMVDRYRFKFIAESRYFLFFRGHVLKDVSPAHG